jgi:SAM-dependent methyltransferase
MHQTAMENCKIFFDAYRMHNANGEKLRIVEIGSQDVNGSLRSQAPENSEYIGVDFVEGKGVDVILDDPYALPFPDGHADIVLSSSCFEHSQMFWLIFLEALRILKPSGLFYLNAPSNGNFHRYPVDCWRFYPDSGEALVAWANRNSVPSLLLESFISLQGPEIWNDYVAVFLKDKEHAEEYPARIIDTKTNFINGTRLGGNDFINLQKVPEDVRKLKIIEKVISGRAKLY